MNKLNKMFSYLKKYMYDSSLDLNKRLFNLIMGTGAVASILGMIVSILIKAALLNIISIFMITLLFSFLAWVGNKYNIINVCAIACGLILNLIIFPLMFFSGGGITSGITSWFMLGFIYIFLMLSGRWFIITFILSALCCGGCYIISYYTTSYLSDVPWRAGAYIDIFVSLMLVSIVVGFLIKFHRRVYNREQDLSRLQQIELEEANKTKSRFLANMSHEIRTPINTIIGLNEMNLRDNINEEVAENCVNIQRASKMLLLLINDILDLSKIESGKMEIVNRQYETGAMLSELVNINWVRAYDKKLEFKLDISPEIPSMLYGDDIRIKQILTNMLTNAIKYTHKGSVTLQAKGEYVDSNHIRLIISVADTGIGIRKEDVKFLFESFKRIDEKKNGAIEGTGLGLAISHQLAELMNGEIKVDSIYQRGTTFTLVLEQEIVDAAPMGSMKDVMKGSLHSRKEYKQSFEAPEARVLIVDDNDMNLMVAAKLLRSTKVQVETAASGKECLDKTRAKYYHAIFMDHMMPGLDGIETLAEIRKQVNGLCRETPVIALTANAFSDAQEFYQAKGFESYLVKPINGSLLEATLLKFLPKELVEVTSAGDEQGVENSNIHMITRKKKRVCITTESVCDLPEDMLESLGVKCIYYYVLTEEGRFYDIREISADNLIEYLDKKEKHARSMPPSVEEYESFFAEALGEAQQIIHISMAKNSGEGYNTAIQAAKGFDNVHVINSTQLSSGMGILVMYAARMANSNNMSFEDIVDRVNHIKHNISTSFIVANTDNMYKAGRMSSKVKEICDAFMLHPVLSMKESKIVCCGIYSGTQEHACIKYIRKQLKGKKNIDTRLLFFTYAGFSLKMKKKVLEEVSKYQKFDKIIEQQASAAISSNCGVGAFGLLYMKKDKQNSLFYS